MKSARRKANWRENRNTTQTEEKGIQRRVFGDERILVSEMNA